MNNQQFQKLPVGRNRAKSRKIVIKLRVNSEERRTLHDQSGSEPLASWIRSRLFEPASTRKQYRANKKMSAPEMIIFQRQIIFSCNNIRELRNIFIENNQKTHNNDLILQVIQRIQINLERALETINDP